MAFIVLITAFTRVDDVSAINNNNVNNIKVMDKDLFDCPRKVIINQISSDVSFYFTREKK